jgi:hypothetical protein
MLSRRCDQQGQGNAIRLASIGRRPTAAIQLIETIVAKLTKLNAPYKLTAGPRVGMAGSAA